MSSRVPCRLRKLPRTRKKNRKQFFEAKGETLDALSGAMPRVMENSHAIFSPIEELTAQLRKADDRIVIFLDGHKYVVSRSKLDEWESI